jgi:hypothetical protein
LVIFLGFALFSTSKNWRSFFSFVEGCAFAECALVVKPSRCQSSLSQMLGGIISLGRSPAFDKSFFLSYNNIINGH